MSPKEHVELLESLYTRAIKLAYAAVERCEKVVEDEGDFDKVELIRKETMKELSRIRPELVDSQEYGITTQEHLVHLDHLIDMGADVCWKTPSELKIYRNQIDAAAKMMPEMSLDYQPEQKDQNPPKNNLEDIIPENLPQDFKVRYNGSLLNDGYMEFLL